jgi:Clathrin light chain
MRAACRLHAPGCYDERGRLLQHACATFNRCSTLVRAPANWRSCKHDRFDLGSVADDITHIRAQDWLSRFNDERVKRIAQAKKDNLAQESSATKGPQGDTDWAKVNSMIDFTFKPPQERETERERFKSLLFAAKTKNVPVKM